MVINQLSFLTLYATLILPKANFEATGVFQVYQNVHYDISIGFKTTHGIQICPNLGMKYQKRNSYSLSEKGSPFLQYIEYAFLNQLVSNIQLPMPSQRPLAVLRLPSKQGDLHPVLLLLGHCHGLGAHQSGWMETCMGQNRIDVQAQVKAWTCVIRQTVQNKL